MEFKSTIKRQKWLLFTATWMDLTRIFLSEKTQFQKVTKCTFQFLEPSEMRRLQSGEQSSCSQGQRAGEGGGYGGGWAARGPGGRAVLDLDCAGGRTAVHTEVMWDLVRPKKGLMGHNNAHFLVVTLFCISARCHHWVKDVQNLSVIFCSDIWIYNNLSINIKKIIRKANFYFCS